jgi:pimeloyl-ACP methyl ester carboxylesterase
MLNMSWAARSCSRASTSGERPLWRELPSWFLIGEDDRIIPPQLQRFMAARAGARGTLEIPGASHALPVSEPQACADLIREIGTPH